MSRRLLPILGALFFLSGVSALIYQVMWLRLLALIFGVTVHAASTVLASFMAGLAVGSFLAGRLADRLRSPLAAFGLLEIGIGLTALATPVVFDGLRAVWITVAPGMPASLPLVTAARFAAAFAVLIVPTALMGATLPIVIRSALVRDQSIGARVGLLYAVNTAGAIAGALTAGFYLISEVGVSRSFAIAAAINVGVGLVALLLSRLPWSRAAAPAPADAPTAPVVAPEPVSAAETRTVLWVFFVSGVASLALEVIWFRILVLFLRPTAYAFTIMLAAVLSGIALGSAIAAPILARRAQWMPALAGLQLAIALAAVLSFNTLAQSPDVLAWVQPIAARLGLDPYLLPLIATSLAAMLPTTILLGVAFPIGLTVWTEGAAAHAPGRGVGTFYSLNVSGAILGSVAAGFVLLPLLGSRASLLGVAGLALASSVALALVQYRARPNVAGFIALVGPVAFAMTALNTVDPFALVVERLHAGERVLWRQEGVQTTVAIHERPASPRPIRVMYLDGLHQANNSAATAFVHHRIGALPVMLHPDPERALVVGLGGGATAGAVAQFPGLAVDAVELSGAVVEGAAFFDDINFGLLTRPGVRLRVADGRNYLLTTRDRYDVITADIILPRHAGAGSLYSAEYFRLVRAALDEDGLVAQWIGAESDSEYRLILRTFLSVFPHTTLWGDGSLMIAGRQPLRVSRAAYEERRQDPAFRALFDWDVATLERLYVAGPEELAAWVGDGPILSDDRPRIEYFLSLPENDPPVDLSGLGQRRAVGDIFIQ